ncbi:hypothetical protein [Cellulosilyticum sp. WCF-2]|uniref:hypothetical protein n=1 Tax=Cellulosilyticum sp. WCF-2 TaxID=2497860 RepID=UPI000F8E20FB|nr:hypothetical protein [Cellulosilyticum sp. WCF-2]QEH70679.1 hypothetical protein EKH84_20735 [Cellulosilyticum sp. WCF-2]
MTYVLGFFYLALLKIGEVIYHSCAIWILSSTSVFKPIFIEGKELINGGAFGFEGGLAVTVVMLITVISSLVLIGKQPQKETFGKSI